LQLLIEPNQILLRYLIQSHGTLFQSLNELLVLKDRQTTKESSSSAADDHSLLVTF
jgi:hypothetical protein